MRLADDFPAIRARMEELRRERARASDHGQQCRRGPTSSSSPLADKRLLAPYMAPAYRAAASEGLAASWPAWWARVGIEPPASAV